MEEQEKTTLHFTRMRAKGDPTFYDPQTDIRQLFPAITKLTLTILQTTYKTDEKAMHDFLYLHNCFCVFQIRLSEDTKPCAEQVAEFFDAVNKADQRNVFLWFRAMFTVITSIYGLFVRRDAKVDGSAIRTMFDKTALAALLASLTPATRNNIYADASKAADAAKLLRAEGETTSSAGFVVCEETGQRIENIQRLASLFISHEGNHDWDALAAACDREFQSGEEKTDSTNIALALAYPTYEQRCLTVEQSV